MEEPLEIWEPVGTTLLASMHLLAVLDDSEGFRVLLQDRRQPWFVYGIYGHVVYYQRNKALPENAYANSAPPANAGGRLLFRVGNSRLLEYLRRSADIEVLVPYELNHFAICLPHEDRIDVVCRGELLIRLASTSSFGVEARDAP